MLTYSIPWYDFSSYFLTPAFLGAEIYTKVINVLQDYPEPIKNFSCFIQRIILGLIPSKKASSLTTPQPLGNTSSQALIPPNVFSRPPPDYSIRPTLNLIIPPPNYEQQINTARASMQPRQSASRIQPPTITQGTQPSPTMHASYPALPTSFRWSCHWHRCLTTGGCVKETALILILHKMCSQSKKWIILHIWIQNSPVQMFELSSPWAYTSRSFELPEFRACSSTAELINLELSSSELWRVWISIKPSPL